LVGNVRIRERDDDDVVEVTNNVMIYIDREETTEYTFITAERRDRLRRADHGFEITDREILLDSDIWPSAKISIFL
jgi:3-phenylpropionate/cinnamic acid dioxygenase small subunit